MRKAGSFDTINWTKAGYFVFDFHVSKWQSAMPVNMPIPDAPKIYHITHLDNLPTIIQDGFLWSDGEALRRNTLFTAVGMGEIKKRRLENLEVACHPETRVGEYVPFYFCPRSVMLFMLWKGNHPGLNYTGGQGPIVHLEADLTEAVSGANANHIQWAFSTSNAGALYTAFYADLNDLNRISWEAVEARDFRAPKIKEGKQAEYLQYHSFPWHLFRRIGVIDLAIQQEVQKRLTHASYIPTVIVKPEWYY